MERLHWRGLAYGLPACCRYILSRGKVRRWLDLRRWLSRLRHNACWRPSSRDYAIGVRRVRDKALWTDAAVAARAADGSSILLAAAMVSLNGTVAATCNNRRNVSCAYNSGRITSTEQG